MKLWLILGLCAVAAATKLQSVASQSDIAHKVEQFNTDTQNRGIIAEALTRQLLSANNHNIIINMLIRQLIAYVRFVINNGSILLGIPRLDPLELDEYHLVIPAGLINMDLHLTKVRMVGLGNFVVHTSNIRFSDLTFDIDVSVPKLHIEAEQYDFDGDLFNAIPLYGKGGAEFIVENFRFRALVFLKQSEDGESVLIDRIQNPSFEIPKFVSNLDGVIGGGNIDTIVNAMIEDVIIGYINRFQGAIARIASDIVITVGNPILDQLDTWKFIRPFV